MESFDGILHYMWQNPKSFSSRLKKNKLCFAICICLLPFLLFVKLSKVNLTDIYSSSVIKLQRMVWISSFRHLGASFSKCLGFFNHLKCLSALRFQDRRLDIPNHHKENHNNSLLIEVAEKSIIEQHYFHQLTHISYYPVSKMWFLNTNNVIIYSFVLLFWNILLLCSYAFKNIFLAPI